MALPASLVWEIRTTASDTNGGGFDPGVASPGTDYSQQDAAQVAYTDLAIDAVTNTKLTSAAHPFTSAHVGNTINVTGGVGFTTGWYNVRSVSGAVATMDRAVGAAGSTNGTGNLGGALASIGQLQAIPWVTQNTAYVKTGSYALSNSVNVSGGKFNFTIGGTATTSIIGYNTTRTLTNTDTTLPAFSASANSMILIDNNNGGNFLYLRNLTFRGNGFTNCVGVRNNNSEMMIENCQAYDMTGGGTGFQNQFNTTKIFNCYAKNCSIGFTAHEKGDLYTACVADSCLLHGFDDTGVTGARYYHCIAWNTSGEGFRALTVGPFYYDCTSAGNTGGSGHGFSINDEATLINCAATGNAGFGFMSNKGAGTVWARLLNCADFNNTSGRADTNFYSDINGVSLVADPFTSSATGNFTPVDNSLALGWPAQYPQNLTTNASDIGASQHTVSAGSGVLVKKISLVR